MIFLERVLKYVEIPKFGTVLLFSNFYIFSDIYLKNFYDKKVIFNFDWLKSNFSIEEFLLLVMAYLFFCSGLIGFIRWGINELIFGLSIKFNCIIEALSSRNKGSFYRDDILAYAITTQNKLLLDFLKEDKKIKEAEEHFNRNCLILAILTVIDFLSGEYSVINTGYSFLVEHQRELFWNMSLVVFWIVFIFCTLYGIVMNFFSSNALSRVELPSFLASELEDVVSELNQKKWDKYIKKQRKQENSDEV